MGLSLGLDALCLIAAELYGGEWRWWRDANEGHVVLRRDADGGEVRHCEHMLEPRELSWPVEPAGSDPWGEAGRR